jgi:hypothetical protein
VERWYGLLRPPPDRATTPSAKRIPKSRIQVAFMIRITIRRRRIGVRVQESRSVFFNKHQSHTSNSLSIAVQSKIKELSIPKKGARRVVVEGVEYIWRVRSRPTYSQAMGWNSLTIAIQQFGPSRGSVLVAELEQSHPSNLVGKPAQSVMPSLVAGCIRRGLKAGWHPNKSGPQFRLANRQIKTPAQP